MNEYWTKTLKGAGIAVAGALLTYAEEHLAGIDFGIHSASAAAAQAVLIQVLRQACRALVVYLNAIPYPLEPETPPTLPSSPPASVPVDAPPRVLD